MESFEIPIAVEGITINALRYLPPKKTLAGKQYKANEVQVTPGVKALNFELNEHRKKIKLKSSEKEVRDYLASTVSSTLSALTIHLSYL